MSEIEIVSYKTGRIKSRDETVLNENLCDKICFVAFYIYICSTLILCTRILYLIFKVITIY